MYRSAMGALLTLVMAAAGELAAGETLRMYAEGPVGYTVLRGEQIYFRIEPRCWGPAWKYFGLGGSGETKDDVRVYDGTTKIGGTDNSVRFVHRARQRGSHGVALEYELTAVESSPLTQICSVLLPLPAFFAGTVCVAEPAGEETKEIALPFGRGNIGAEVKGLVFHDKEGRELRVTIEPPRTVSMDGEGRIALAATRMNAGETLATTVTLSFADEVKFFADDKATLQRDDTSNWFPYATGPAGVPVDLSFLNKDAAGNFVPAGMHGFLKVKDGDFLFEDGTPARFWGVNCTAGAVLGSEERGVQLAERLARLGCNIVRLHHLDSWANPIIDYDHPDGTTQHLNPASMKLLDRFVSEMKKRGVYVVLDPWVQRCFKPADDVADYGNLGTRGNFNLHPYIYFDARMQELIRKQWRQVWTHVNEFTGVAYKDEPACPLTEVINEGLLTGLNGVKQEVYQRRLQDRYEAWAAENNGLPWDKANVIGQNYGDNNIAFMMYLHRDFYRKSHETMRDIGLKIPITMNNWAHWTWVMAVQSDGDFMDHHHYYGGDQVGPGSGLGGLWVHHPPNVPGTPFGKMAGFALPGKPVMSSEYGNNPPKTYRSAYSLGLAAVASFQGWDSFTGYAYSQGGRPADTLGAFEWESDPAMVASLIAGALVYRRGDVRRAEKTVVFQVPEAEIYALRWEDGGEKQYWHTAGFNAAIERHKVLVCLPGTDPAGFKPVEDLDADSSFAYDLPTTEVHSDTGELWRDWQIGVGTIDTPRTQAAYGKLGESGKEWNTRDCSFRISTPFAVASLSSLTDEPIPQSGKLLLTAVARAQNTGMAFNMARTAIVQIGNAPVIAEPVVGTIRIKTARAKLTLYPVGVDGARGEPVAVPVKDGEAHVELTADHETVFYEIEAR